MKTDRGRRDEREGRMYIRHRINGYLALQGNTHFGAEWFETILELPARKRLGTRWLSTHLAGAEYTSGPPFHLVSHGQFS